MITILSPAKNMKMIQYRNLNISKPINMEKTNILASILKQKQPYELENILKLNPELAFQAFANFQAFDLSRKGTPAILAYHGLLYKHLNAHDFTKSELVFANEHLCILSAFYGILKPLDGILPYRLEMNCKLKIEQKNLYEFWANIPYEFCKDECIINLASAEYARLIQSYAEKEQFITCDFLDYKKGEFKILPAYAKMARGAMARFIVKNKVNVPEKLKEFDWDDYEFSEKMSKENHFVFIRDFGLTSLC